MVNLLSGYRIIESSMLLNGATTTMMLADLGAEVIKVESPFLGDYLRMPETRLLHLQANKNKRSIALDLRSEKGQAVFYRLLSTADAFVTNAVGDRNERLGISYEQMRRIKADIVYCQNTGFGATGPYRNMPVHGQMMEAIAGALPAELGDNDLTAPKQVGSRSGTLMSAGEGTAAGAVYAALHVAAALAHRANSGEGCYIDISAAEAVIASAWVAAIAQANSEEAPSTSPAERAEAAKGTARYQFYEARDHKMLLFCPEEKKFWQTFCDQVDRPDLKDQVSGVPLRHELQAIFRTRDRQEWIDLGVEHRIPIGPANDGLAEVRADPHLASRHIFVDGLDERGQPFTYIGQPGLVDGGAVEVSRCAPELGEHTDEVLAELGYSSQEIESLAEGQVTTSANFRSDFIADVHAGPAGQDRTR